MKCVESSEINAWYVYAEDEIYVSTAAAQRLHEYELGALIAHEIGHRALKHGPRCMVTEIGSGVIVALSAITLPGLELFAAVNAWGLGCCMHRVWCEIEADHYAATRAVEGWRSIRQLLQEIQAERNTPLWRGDWILRVRLAVIRYWERREQRPSK